MDFRELEYLTAIARCGSLTAAAQALYVSQPTLSKCLQHLEDELGIKLFEYVGRKMLPTYAGQRYLYHAQRLLAQKRELEGEMGEILKLNAGRLQVGMPPFRCSVYLPKVLPEFHQKYPNVEFSILESDSAEIDAALTAGRIDLAFYMSMRRTKGLEYRVLHKDRLYAVMSKDHPLNEKGMREGSLSLLDMADENLLIQGRQQRQGQYVLQELQNKHLVPKSVMESRNIRATTALAANGYGIAFITGELLENVSREVPFSAYPLSDCVLPLEMVAAWRESAFLPQYALDFIDLMQKYAPKNE